MIWYSDLYLGDDKANKFHKRFHDFGYAQYVCNELELADKPYYLLLWNEKDKLVTVLRRFRIPKLQTNPH